MITKLESYLLAWYFAAMHTVHDCNEKRDQKGLLFTIGDEPNLRHLPSRSIEEIMGTPSQSSYTDIQLLELVQKTYDVYHIVVNHSYSADRSRNYWEGILAQNCITITDYSKVADTIADIVLANVNARVLHTPKSNKPVLETEDLVDGGIIEPKSSIKVDSSSDEEIL